MSTTIHLGKKRVNTVASSDGSTIPPGGLTVTSQYPGSVSASVDAQNNVTLTGLIVCPGCNVTYNAPGFVGVTEVIVVPTPPSLIVTDGPEQ